MAATAAAVSRLRTALESSRGFTLRGRLSLTPSVEVGLRHDASDAEQGSGVDVGGGLVVSDTATGLAVDLRVRMLLWCTRRKGFGSGPWRCRSATTRRRRRRWG